MECLPRHKLTWTASGNDFVYTPLALCGAYVKLGFIRSVAFPLDFIDPFPLWATVNENGCHFYRSILWRGALLPVDKAEPCSKSVLMTT